MVARAGSMPAAGGQGSASQVPWGWLGYTQVTANQTAISAAVDLTGLSQAVTVGTSRRIRIRVFANLVSTGVGASTARLRIMEGATQLQEATGSHAASGYTNSLIAEAILTPSAGAHTYKAVAASNGTHDMSASSTLPASILIEDIGPAS